MRGDNSLEGLLRPLGSRLLRDPGDTRLRDLEECDSIAVVGVPWDWNTGGDPGARHAPPLIIGRLMSLPILRPGLGALSCRPRLAGEIAVAGGNWRLTRERIRRAGEALWERHRFVLFAGGDHSISRPIIEALLSKGSVGVLMLDAHYDMRSVEEGVTSGSWLWELLSEATSRMRSEVDVAIVGVADYANPPYLEERASRLGVRVVPARRVHSSLEEALEAVDWLLERGHDDYYITVDMDHIAEAYAPGVNSPSPAGLAPWESLEIIERAVEKLGPAGADIVEVVPVKDRGGATVRLAALVGATILWGVRRVAG